MTFPDLGTALDGIMTALNTKFEADRVPGGKLAAVKTLARGDITAPDDLAMPAIWYYPGEMQPPDGVSLNIRETWRLPMGIAAIVWSDKPIEGTLAANTLAAAARGILITREKRRDLGLPYVRDIKSGRFVPCNPLYTNKTRSTFAAMAAVEILFIVEE